MEVVQLSLLLQSGQRQHRVGISLVPVEAALRDGIEERKKSIKILLLDRIVLVIVTAGATHGESQPGRCRRARAVHHILHVIFLRYRAAFEVDHVVAVESARDFLLDRCARKQVTGQLLDRELVERHVAVEGVNYPIPPRPHLAQAVDVIPMSIGVTR